jgi:hypothetical protein
MNLNHIKQRIVTARSVGLDFVDSTPPEVQSALMDLASIAEHLLSQRGVAPLMSSDEIAMLRVVTHAGAREYEILGSWWTSWVPWDWAQDLAASWFRWKTRRKWTRYAKMSIQISKSKT